MKHKTSKLFHTNIDLQIALPVTLLFMGILILLVIVFHIPNPNMILIAGLIICSALFGYRGGIPASLVMFTYTLFFFSEGNDFITFTGDDVKKVLVSLTGIIVDTLFVCRLKRDSVLYYIKNQKLMTKLEEDNRYLQELSMKDSLTGVMSKHAYVEHERKIAASIYDHEPIEFGVVVCDVNGLKLINDSLGHSAGDDYLCSAANMLVNAFSRSPIYRIGGDEFAIILQGRDYQERESILNSLNNEIEQHIGTDKVIASLGCSVYQPDVDNTYHGVFARADRLMYERKRDLKAMKHSS